MHGSSVQDRKKLKRSNDGHKNSPHFLLGKHRVTYSYFLSRNTLTTNVQEAAPVAVAGRVGTQNRRQCKHRNRHTHTHTDRDSLYLWTRGHTNTTAQLNARSSLSPACRRQLCNKCPRRVVLLLRDRRRSNSSSSALIPLQHFGEHWQ